MRDTRYKTLPHLHQCAHSAPKHKKIFYQSPKKKDAPPVDIVCPENAGIVETWGRLVKMVDDAGNFGGDKSNVFRLNTYKKARRRCSGCCVIVAQVAGIFREFPTPITDVKDIKGIAGIGAGTIKKVCIEEVCNNLYIWVPAGEGVPGNRRAGRAGRLRGRCEARGAAGRQERCTRLFVGDCVGRAAMFADGFCSRPERSRLTKSRQYVQYAMAGPGVAPAVVSAPAGPCQSRVGR